MNTELCRESLLLNLTWFETSGAMDPPDGSWGVAERIALTHSNPALEKIHRSFPAYTEHDGYSVIEQRRPDCNFEAALLFRLAADALDQPRYRDIAANLLRYLHCRSGMRNPDLVQFPAGGWRWSHIQWEPRCYFDDNAWNCAASLALAKLDPGFDAEFGLRDKAVELATSMASDFRAYLERNGSAQRATWAGDVRSPHWGALACMAFAFAHSAAPDERFREETLRYLRFLQQDDKVLTTSEHAYITLGFPLCSAAFGDDGMMQLAQGSADELLSMMAPAGNIPSQWRETPAGEHLVDLVYTQNWATLGLQALGRCTGDRKYAEAMDRSVELLCTVQDRSPEPHLTGCWRGLYDLDAGNWGGGDLYEGGANSIYTGWTNAPIALAMAFALRGTSLADCLP